jgi:membrane protein DedA with SNARE-associated domain
VLRDLVDTLTPWFSDWGLVIVLVATFVESSVLIASILPGESVLLLAGFFASPSAVVGQAPPPLQLEQVIAIAFAGAFAGDLVGYAIGRAAGRAIVRRFGRFILLPERKLPVLERYFTQYGGRAILLGRFAPFLRSVRTLVAGIARMSVWRFLVFDLLAAAAWAAAIPSIGFLLGESWHVADRSLGAGGFAVFVVLGILFFVSWRRMRARLEREMAAAGGANAESRAEGPQA